MAVIRELLNVPESYRAVPERKRTRRTRPEPSQEMLDRLNQFLKAGIPAEMKYEPKTRSYSITAKTLTPPEWDNNISASDQWKAAALC